MVYRADLHTHSTASDGQYTPGELVKKAKGHGLSILAVTDHDTIAGGFEAMAAGKAQGLRVIRGVELSAKERKNFHILGYGFRDGDTELARLCEKFRVGRDDRKYKIVDFLREKGVNIDLAEVEELAGGGPYPVVLANIVADVIIPLSAQVERFLPPAEGVFICSGIIDTRADEVEKALKKNGLRILERIERNGWCAMAAEPA